MKKVVAAGFAVCACVAFANDWYVDPTVPDDSHDGTSSNVVSATVGPKRTLAGVMAAGVGVGDGDTVWLLPGEHKEGTMNGGLNRLYVTQKNLKVKSLSGNPFDTSIVGEYDVGVTNNFTGADSVSCVKFAKAAKDCIVEGVMLRDATARYLGDTKEYGGGIYDQSMSCWAINCVFSNCSARAGGGLYGGSAVRCRFIHCAAGNTSTGSAIHTAKQAAFCLFQDCDWNSSGARGVYVGPTLFLNCTITGAKRAFFASTCTALNTISINNYLSGRASNGKVSGAQLYATNSVFGALGTSTYLDENEIGNCLTNQTLAQIGFVSPETGDWRIWDSFDAATIGDARHLQSVELPEGYEHRDLYGNLVPTEGAIPAGCALARIQTFGTIVFKEAMSLRGVGSFAKNDTYRPTETCPFFLLEPAEGDGRRLFSVSVNVGGVSALHYPLPDGSIPFEAPSSPGATVELTPRFVTDVRYADPVNGNDGWDGTMAVHEKGTDHGPKETLQEAYNVTTGSYPLVLAAAGVYSNGVTKIEDQAGAPCLRRLVCRNAVGIRAVEGPDKTFLVGAPDPETGGLGANAVAGVFMSGKSFFQGFTVTGCYTPTGTTKAYQDGAAFSGNTEAHILDCVASNNVAETDVARYVTALRCQLVGNTVDQFVVRNAFLGGCLLANNTIGYSDATGQNAAYAHTGSKLYGCTVDMRSPAAPQGRLSFLSNDSAAYGCVVTGYRGTGTDGLTDCVVNDNLALADREAFDYRLGVLSSAIGAVDRLSLPADYLRLTAYSIDGSFPDVNAAGRQTAGAYQKTPRLPCVVLAAGVEADGFVAGTNVLVAGESGQVTFTVNFQNLTRPYVGVVVNGEVRPMAESVTCELPAAGESLQIALVPATNWYVNAAAGSDAYGGGTPETAKATISAAAAKAVAGDVIHVAPGTYGEAEGARKHASGAILETRVVVPSGVSLLADDPEETFIVGAESDAPQDDYGNGPNAVRCVYLAAGATIRGFTLTGGHTRALADEADADLRGSAVFGVSAETCLVENCIVSNNASRLGTLRETKNVKCRVIDNVGTSSSSAGHSCGWYGCVIDRNRGNETVRNPTMIASCTFGTGNSVASGSPQIIYYYETSFPVCNSVLLYGRFHGYPCMTNCLLLSGMPTDGNRITNNWCNCVTVANASAAKVNADCTLKADSPAIDRGDAGICEDFCGGVDAFGGPRVMNGCLDIGAHEWDWRPTYAKALGRRITVTDASPAVSNSTEGVVIPSGELAGTIGKAGRGGATFEITGNGTLSVYLNDVLVGAYAAGETSAELGDLEAGVKFRFVYAPGDGDAGVALVKGLKARTGAMLIIR